MTSKERVRAAISHKIPDRVPANFEATPTTINNLLKHYGFSDKEKLLQKFEIDIREICPDYIGKPLVKYQKNGVNYIPTAHGYTLKEHWTGKEYNYIVSEYPFGADTTVKDIENFDWVNPDDFDYESVKRQCEKYKDKALIFGHEGPFQLSTFMMNMDELFIKMSLEPEVAHRLYDRFVEFELEYYERILIAGDGQIDILRPHDDYGTQNSLLFSVEMWKEFFEENTKKLTALAHKYGCFYQQHSCGAVSKIIPSLIECNVDVLEPLQKVNGMEIELLKKTYGDKLAFQGGIDTQNLLPFGTAEQVKQETQRYINILGENGGYILMASQRFEGDVPIENIEAVYSVKR